MLKVRTNNREGKTMDAHFQTTVTLTNQKVHFEGVSRDNPQSPIAFDYIPPVGDGQGYKGLELLLMSFSGCVSTAVVFLLRKMGKNIASYKMHAEGYCREEPLSLQKISARIEICSKDIIDSDMQAVITKAAVISPVWRSLNENIEVELKYEIV
jgi:putative redox protein